MRGYDLASAAPLVILFDQPLADLQQQLQSLVADSDDLAIETCLDQSFLSVKVQQGGVGFDVIWSEARPVLTGYRSVFFGTVASENSVLLSVNLTEDLNGGERVAPIAKAMLMFGARIARRLSAQAVIWTPAKIISDPKFFAENVENYANGEIFPVLVTVDFDYEDEERTLRSSGLAWFSGQEIELTGGGLQGQELVRRAIRLVHDIATNGPVMMTQRAPDLDDEKSIDLVVCKSDELLRCLVSSKNPC